MTLAQQIITIGLCVLGTMTTRFLPFMIFNEHRKTPEFIQYLGKYLPSAVFGMLVIYCLKNVSVFHGSHGIPELISILVTGWAAYLETPDAHLHCGWDYLLYAADAVCVLTYSGR